MTGHSSRKSKGGVDSTALREALNNMTFGGGGGSSGATAEDPSVEGCLEAFTVPEEMRCVCGAPPMGCGKSEET